MQMQNLGEVDFFIMNILFQKHSFLGEVVEAEHVVGIRLSWCQGSQVPVCRDKLQDRCVIHHGMIYRSTPREWRNYDHRYAEAISEIVDLFRRDMIIVAS